MIETFITDNGPVMTALLDAQIAARRQHATVGRP